MRMSLFNRRKKPIIVTIHGFGRNLSHEFDSLARYLKAKKYEVIQFDMYDLNNPNDANYKDWVQRCEAKLSLAIKENPNVILIGFSMGGVIASYLASIYKVQSLILCAPAFEYLDIKKVTGLFKKSDKELEGMIDGGIKEIPFGTRSQRQDYFVSNGKNSSDRFHRRKMVEHINSQFNDFPA